MQTLQRVCLVIVGLAVLGGGDLSVAQEQGKSPPTDKAAPGKIHSVEATVDYPSGPTGVGIQAEKRPGQFTIPKGSKGTKLKYRFADPKSGYTSTKLRGSNIYSVTEKRYMHELDHNPDFELPPGEYKFVVGGLPGASGALSFTELPGIAVNPPPGDPKSHSHTHKPPPKHTATDKEDGPGAATTVPGGARRKKVVVNLVVDSTDGKLDAWLTIDGNKLTLEFILPVFEGHLNVVKNTWLWEGALEKEARGTTTSGKTNYESNSIYQHGHNTRFTVKGVFTATREGNVLTGAFEEHTAWASDGAPPAWRRKGRWRIEGVSP